MPISRGAPTQYAAVLASWAAEEGCSTAQLLAGTQLHANDLKTADQYISTRDLITMVVNAYAVTGNDAIGLEFGSRLNISSHIALGHALMNSSTFGQAIELVLKYYRIVAPELIFDSGKLGHEYHITIRSNDYEGIPAHFSTEACLAAIYSSSRFLLQRQDLPFELEFAYGAPSYVEDYYRVFGKAITFDCANNRLSFSGDLSALNIVTANSALLGVYEEQCRQLLKSLERQDSTADKIRHLLRRLDTGYPQLEQVADLLATSPRTLRRRLKAEDTHYQKIIDEVRCDHAIELLNHSSMPLSSISYMLGFNDVSNFRRAFIRWTGKAPLAYRENRSKSATSMLSD